MYTPLVTVDALPTNAPVNVVAVIVPALILPVALIVELASIVVNLPVLLPSSPIVVFTISPPLMLTLLETKFVTVIPPIVPPFIASPLIASLAKLTEEAALKSAMSEAADVIEPT